MTLIRAEFKGGMGELSCFLWKNSKSSAPVSEQMPTSVESKGLARPDNN